MHSVFKAGNLLLERYLVKARRSYLHNLANPHVVYVESLSGALSIIRLVRSQEDFLTLGSE